MNCVPAASVYVPLHCFSVSVFSKNWGKSSKSSTYSNNGKEYSINCRYFRRRYCSTVVEIHRVLPFFSFLALLFWTINLGISEEKKNEYVCGNGKRIYLCLCVCYDACMGGESISDGNVIMEHICTNCANPHQCSFYERLFSLFVLFMSLRKNGLLYICDFICFRVQSGWMERKIIELFISFSAKKGTEQNCTIINQANKIVNVVMIDCKILLLDGTIQVIIICLIKL